MCVEYVTVGRRTRFLDDFWVPRDPVFLNDFRASSSLCALKISASAVERGSRDDFWVSSDAFFINGFCVSISLCGLKISASAVELGFKDYFWDSRD